MQLSYLLLCVCFGLLSCLPTYANAHELTETLALRAHHAQDHRDSSLLNFVLDHCVGQHHRHDTDGSDQKHQSLPFSHAHAHAHAHDCAHVMLAWTDTGLVPAPRQCFRPAAVPPPRHAASAPVSVVNPCWPPPRA